MKVQTLKERIENKLFTKKGEIAVKYANIYEFIRKAKRFHGCEWNGSARHMRLSDAQHRNLCEALRLIGVDYVTGNDAPRGGATGTFVELTPKGKRQTAELRKELQAEWEEERRKEAEECDKTYNACKGIDIFQTKTAEKYGIVFKSLKNQPRMAQKPIIHELAAELKQFNNAGFKKYVFEQF